MIRPRALIAGLVLAAAACGPTVQVANLGPTFPARRPAEDLIVYSTRVPDCAYGEIALVTAYRGDMVGDAAMDRALDALKDRARSLGADAVVGLRVVSGGMAGNTREGYSATAIRFTDQACTH